MVVANSSPRSEAHTPAGSDSPSESTPFASDSITLPPSDKTAPTSAPMARNGASAASSSGPLEASGTPMSTPSTATPATFGTVGLTPAPTEPPPAKAFRRRWAYHDDYTLLKEIVKAEAHISPSGKMTERYTKAANAFNADPTTRWSTDHKHAKDNFYLLKGGFEALDRRRRDGTGQEEVLSSMENLLVTTVEEHNRYQQKVAAKRNERRATEEELTLKDKTVRDAAMACRGAGAMPGVTEGGTLRGGWSGGDPKKSSSTKTATRARARSELEDGDDA